MHGDIKFLREFAGSRRRHVLVGEPAITLVERKKLQSRFARELLGICRQKNISALFAARDWHGRDQEFSVAGADVSLLSEIKRL